MNIMMISLSALTLICSIAIFIFGFIFSFIGFLLKRVITEKIDEALKKVSQLDDKFNCLREEMVKNYVPREEFESNKESHKEIWVELNNQRERIKGVETRIEVSQ